MRNGKNSSESILPPSLRRSVIKLIEKVKKYNNAYEVEDYLHEAVLAYLEKKNHYMREKNGQISKMKNASFLYWYIENAIYKLADTQEVSYVIYDNFGRYFKTLSNKQFRKEKKSLEKKGYQWRSVKNIESIFFTDDNGKERIREIGIWQDPSDTEITIFETISEEETTDD
ncbi:MAG: hypothetical protein N3A69_14715 [Leptospiraceae bacterium]|nr:hypothetical protein [Leptospiraceae bacterium]